MTTLTTRTNDHDAQVEALQDHMLSAAGGVFTSFSIYIGHRLGFYSILSDNDEVTSTELTSLADTNERYTREWLEQQTTAGILDVNNPADGPYDRKYALPAAHAEVLANRDSVNYLTPLTQILVGVTRPMDNLIDCFRHGGGINYAEYGIDMRHGQSDINRMTFLTELGTQWVSQVPGLAERLRQPGARAMDFGCGCGWSSIALAEAFPTLHVDAYDTDAASINEARAHAVAHGVADRITFHREDVTKADAGQDYDLFVCCETLHDLADPVGALKAAKRHLKPSGTAIVVDERVADTFMGEGGDVEWMMYGWSILHCLPAGMADGAEHHCGGTGTVMRLPTLKQYAAQAGFQDVEVLPIENLFFNVYQLQSR